MWKSYKHFEDFLKNVKSGDICKIKIGHDFNNLLYYDKFLFIKKNEEYYGGSTTAQVFLLEQDGCKIIKIFRRFVISRHSQLFAIFFILKK